jgi:hypothetical protein
MTSLIVQNEETTHGDCHRLVPFVEFPFVDAVSAVTEVDTSMIEQISWGGPRV